MLDEAGDVVTAERCAYDQLPLGALVLRGGTSAVATNKTWLALTGLSREETLGLGWLEAVSPADRDRVRDAIGQSLGGCVDGSLDCTIDGLSGRRWSRWWWHGVPGRSGNGVVTVLVADMQHDRHRERDLLRRATHDALTGLANRSYLLEATEQALSDSDDRSSVAMAFVDLDGFKVVNDTYGHAVGDEVLKAAAARLARAVRPVDVVARVGGDEFAVLCRTAHPAAWATAIEARVAASYAAPFHLGPIALRVGASLGVAIGDRYDTAGTLLDRADRAMYENRATLHPPDNN